MVRLQSHGAPRRGSTLSARACRTRSCSWRRFEEATHAAHDYFLLLEDDVAIAEDFFVRLPCLLRGLQSLDRDHAAPDWHALRFSTWGARHEADRLPYLANLPVRHAVG